MDFLFDDFRTELTASLLTLEFNATGRITQLWASDPALPDEGEDFQFVLPAIAFGEEAADDYFPGTVLLGVRSDPAEPWVVSRNRSAKFLNVEAKEDEDDEDLAESLLSRNDVRLEYGFPLIEGLSVTGHFHEAGGMAPQVIWDLTIKNVGRRTLEIGELGFPLAFNNLYDGFGWNDEQLRKLWHSRVYIHKSIGGAASWVFAQRMTAESPGLLVFPGADTSWEFYTHVRGSLNTPNQWEGIPVVYVHSKATIDREEWPTWFNEHTSLILEPGDSRTVQTRFFPTDSDKQDGVAASLQACGRPTVKVLPSAVAPIDVGIGLEVTGVGPKRFFVSREATTEVDSDETSGFCFVKPSEPGPLIVSFQDVSGNLCHAHLMFTEPIGELIRRRARWIVENQRVAETGGAFDDAVLLTNIATGEVVTDPGEYMDSSGLECSVADALYLAEKNALFPHADEVAVVDRYVENFLLDDVQNPSNGAVASLLVNGAPAYFGRPMAYPTVANLYHSMSRIARSYGGTTRDSAAYLRLAAQTYLAMFEHGWRMYVRSVGVVGFARAYELHTDLIRAGMGEEAEALMGRIEFKARALTKLQYPFAGETVMDTSGFEEVFAAGRFLDDDEHMERTVRCAFATRSLAPSWWWYGSDKRHWDGGDSTPSKALLDRGEACLGHTTTPNSSCFFGLMDRDYLGLPDAYLRMAFGGMMGPWALVRHDGAASMCYCPDLSSKQAGYNPYTGASGLGYFHYLRTAASWVLPSREQGILSFGCHYMLDEDVHVVRPWDGVGRRIVMRQVGVDFELDFGCFTELRLDGRLRSFEALISNPADREISTVLRARGLWGRTLTAGGVSIPLTDGGFEVPLTLGAGGSIRLSATLS